MELDFPTFAALFMLGFILLAFLELAVKSKPMTKPEFEGDYELPPLVDKLQHFRGEWRHKDDGRLATKEEVLSAGLLWPSTPPGSAAAKRKTGFYGDSNGVTGSGIDAEADKKSN